MAYNNFIKNSRIFGPGKSIEEENKSRMAKRHIFAEYFFNLSVATFAGMVVGIIIQPTEFLTVKMISIVIVGTVSTIAFAWAGFKILAI